MTQQIVQVGNSANDNKGDSLRAAFQKVNANFTELYTALGLDSGGLNLGAFEFTGSTISTTDSSGITIDQSVTVTSDLIVGGDIVPSGNLASTLGSPTNKFHSLYVGVGSVYIGDARLSLEDGKLVSSVGFNLTGSVGEVAGVVQWTNVQGKPTFATVATSGSYNDLSNKPTIPADVSDLTDNTGLLNDLSAVDKSIIPDTDVAYDLGSTTKRFRDLYLSGTTIDLGGALITTTDDGNVSLPGVTERRFKPGSIEDGRQDGETFFNESALPENSVIIDQATWIWAATGGNQSGGTFQPSVYSATFNGSGFITAISIVEANYYDDTNDWVTVNRDNLYVVPAGTLLTAQSISAVGSPIGVLAAGVISTSESIANIPSLTIPTDIADLTDNTNLLGSGSALGFTYNESGGTSEIGVTADVFDFGDGKTIDMQNSTVLFTGSTVSGILSLNTDYITIGVGGSINMQGSDIGAAGSISAVSVSTLDLTTNTVRSEGDINISVNLTDSTTRNWAFTEGGDLTLPNGYAVNGGEAGVLSVGSDRLGVRLNSTDQSTLMVAKQSFNRTFDEDATGYTFSILNTPNRVRVTFDANNGLYLKELLTRWSARYELIEFGDPVDFEYDYSNIRLSLEPDTYDIVTNVVNVSQFDELIFDIEIDQDPIAALVGAGAEAEEIGQIALRYDYNNTVGFDIENNKYGMAVDHDDIDLRAGRDIDLDAADDFRVVAGSTFSMSLERNDDQADDDGIFINLRNNWNTALEDTKTWTFGFNGNLYFPQDGDIFNVAGLNNNNDVNITINNDDSSTYTWNFGNTGDLTAPGDVTTGLLNVGGRFIQDCADGTTSMRWINVEEGIPTTQLIRAYTGDPKQDTEIERAQLLLNWSGDSDEYSGFTIKSFDNTDPDNPGEYDWLFQGDGTLRLPASSVGGGIGLIYSPADKSLWLSGTNVDKTTDGNGVVLNGGQNAGTGRGGGISLFGGNSVGGRGGNIFIEAGLGAGSNDNGVISIGTAYAKSVDIGRTGSSVNLHGTVDLSNASIAGDIRSEGDIEININLSDSTLRRWSFGEDGSLTLAGPITNLRTDEGKIALGFESGLTNQGAGTVAVGQYSGRLNQGGSGVAVGGQAGNTDQGVSAVAVGTLAGGTNQGVAAVAVGALAGGEDQGQGAVAVGQLAGGLRQGEFAIAIGTSAGVTDQAANSIVINATSGTVENTTANSFVVKPVRDAAGTSILQYNSSTGEITHTNEIYSDQQISITVSGEDSTQKTWYFGNDGILNLPAGGDIVDSTGTSVLGGGGGGSVLEEPFESKTSATGVIEHDATTNRLFYHTSISANFTANFTNLGLSANEATSVSLVLVQGATARMCTAVQIGGAAQTIVWQGSALAPTGNANRTDVVTFSILCTATDTYTVLGMLTSFGG